MTTDLVEKCALAGAGKMNCGCFIDAGMTHVLCDDARLPDAIREPRCDCRRAVIAVIDALADGVTPEMVQAFRDAMEPYTDGSGWHYDRALSAAIRAAKSREGHGNG